MANTERIKRIIIALPISFPAFSLSRDTSLTNIWPIPKSIIRLKKPKYTKTKENFPKLSFPKYRARQATVITPRTTCIP